MWIREYWDLIEILTTSYLRVKYQSSILGFAWSLINPLFIMLILYIVFSHIFGVSDSQYALYILIGITTYRFFSNATSMGMTSIVSNSGLVTKVFIPRQILVFSAVLSGFISSILEFSVLFILMILLGAHFYSTVLLLPLILLLFFLMIYSLALGLASLYVLYRDLNQIWEVILQAAFFLSPIVYSISAIPEQYLQLYMLNPVTTTMVTIHDILLYGTLPDSVLVLYLVLISIFLLFLCRFIFNRIERRFAEEV